VCIKRHVLFRTCDILEPFGNISEHDGNGTCFFPRVVKSHRSDLRKPTATKRSAEHVHDFRGHFSIGLLYLFLDVPEGKSFEKMLPHLENLLSE